MLNSIVRIQLPEYVWPIRLSARLIRNGSDQNMRLMGRLGGIKRQHELLNVGEGKNEEAML